MEERVDERVALRVLAPEVGAQHVALGLGERVGLVGDAPGPLEAREGIAGGETLLAGVAVERAERAVDDVARGLRREPLPTPRRPAKKLAKAGARVLRASVSAAATDPNEQLFARF